MKFRLPVRRRWRIAIYLASFFLVLLAIDLVLVQTRRTIRPGFETTRVVAPLQADGSIDYLTAMEDRFGQGVTPENNAAPLLLKAMGRVALPKNQPTDGITDRLGMPHLPELGEHFVAYQDYCRAQAAEGSPDLPDTSKPWPPVIKPLTVQWIKDNQRPLDLIAQASKRPRFFIPFYGGNHPETLVEILLPHIQPLRNVGQAMETRALIRLEAGDIAGFREDVLALHRLARLVGQAPTLVERMLAESLEAGVCRVDRLAAASGTLSTEQARMLVVDLDQMGDLPPVMDGIDGGERFLLLDAIQAMARMGPVRAGQFFHAAVGGDDDVFGTLFRFIPVPYEECMRQANRFYDGALAAARQPTHAQRLAALRLWEHEIIKVQAKPTILTLISADGPVKFFLPGMIKVLETADRVRMENQLTQVTLALAAFKADHHAYPATLADLSPTYLRAVPYDLFSDKPLIYSRTAGGYQLYSVGPNMVDDGGKTEKPADDLVVHVP